MMKYNEEQENQLNKYRILRMARERHVNDLQDMFDLVNSQLHIAKLNLKSIEKMMDEAVDAINEVIE
tara:strand:+ start:363 stop:563 length:201 start_codon:yes stop_codon:yes gene_type:complete